MQIDFLEDLRWMAFARITESTVIDYKGRQRSLLLTAHLMAFRGSESYQYYRQPPKVLSRREGCNYVVPDIWRVQIKLSWAPRYVARPRDGSIARRRI